MKYIGIFEINFQILKISQMKNKPLEVGDQIFLTNGMAIEYADFENVFYEAGKLEGKGKAMLYIGKTYMARGDHWSVRVKLRSAIHELFKAEGLLLDDNILMRFLQHQVRDSESRMLVIPEGLYEVTQVLSEGEARKVHCKTVDISGYMPIFEISFYQNSQREGRLNMDGLRALRS